MAGILRKKNERRLNESVGEFFKRVPFEDVFAKGAKKAAGGAVFRKDTKEEKQISFFQKILTQLEQGTIALNENLGPLDF